MTDHDLPSDWSIDCIESSQLARLCSLDSICYEFFGENQSKQPNMMANNNICSKEQINHCLHNTMREIDHVVQTEILESDNYRRQFETILSQLQRTNEF